MTTKEAEAWWDQLTKDQQIQILKEHYELKQHLCAQRLLVPTGCDDWIIRALKAADSLQKSRSLLRQIVFKGAAMIEEASREMNDTTCSNCMGRKVTSDGNSCVCCGGTGYRQYSPLHLH